MAARKDQKFTPEQIERMFDCAKRVTPRTKYGVVEAAQEAGCSRATMSMVRLILESGTSEEIKAVRNGNASIRSLSEAIRRNPSSDDRLANLTPKMAADKERRAQDAALYQTLKDALLKLTGLPRGRDVVAAIHRLSSRNDDVERCLPLAIQWLKEFEHEFDVSKAA